MEIYKSLLVGAIDIGKVSETVNAGGSIRTTMGTGAMATPKLLDALAESNKS